ncbi:energy transducer TonB [uncultured Desulfosarcina sp.]|uniref:energy transducer TonB family protein n=1 Tax=uncultured Desulfosarcina sp. TaxID=218289 RepID=UPI0029C6AF1E|nr:energy transducer TonB [uncultured Desulfosarcina sp.]
MEPQHHPSSMEQTSEPNWLLRTLIIFSLVAHTGIFIHISGIYHSSTLSYIEMTLQNIARPVTREIPRPRPRPKMPSPTDPVKKLNVVQRPLPRFKPLAMAPVESNLPDSLMEEISAPDMPQTPGVDSTDWVPGPQAQETTGEFMTASSYLDMVRLKIESRKRYPDSAKSRSIEGRVTIRFILLTDGNVRDLTVTKSARSKALNVAALDAIQRAAPFPRPPSNLFKGDLPLELTIVFELT